MLGYHLKRQVNVYKPINFSRIFGKIFLIIIDLYTKWMKVYFMNPTTAEQIIFSFKDYWAIQSIMKISVTKNGPPFSSNEFSEFTSQSSIKHVQLNLQTTAGVMILRNVLLVVLNINLKKLCNLEHPLKMLLFVFY